MWRELKVLVIDDNVQRLRDLKLVLDFLGVAAETADLGDWRAKVDGFHQSDSPVICVLLGATIAVGRTGVAIESCVSDIKDWNPDVAVVTVGETELTESLSLPADLRHMLVDNLTMPPTYNQLLDTLYRAQRYREARDSSQRLSGRPVHLFRSLVGTSRQITQVREMMAQVADKDVTVLITGESGTGKEVVARNLHYHSDRRDKPFVPVNCGAIPAELLESELFGHEKGAFTGAISTRAGRFEMAEGGTLFLDEIGDMPLNMQVKILRVLQERTFERVGSNRTQEVNVRIIAATHRNLEEMIEEGNFREDLFYRLNVFPIEMPSLRERSEDLPLLLSELVSRIESENKGAIRFNSAAIMSLYRHEWSGNIRELANLVERMAIMHPSGVIGVSDLPKKYQHLESEEEEFSFEMEMPSSQATVISMNDTTLLPDQGIDLKEYLTTLEKNLIQQALDDSGGVVARAADRLSIRRTTLVEKMRKYELHRT